MTRMHVLAVGAHPDDIELGCGGTLCRAVSTGAKVVAIFLTKGERSYDPESRVKGSRKALAALGVTEVHFGDFPDTDIPSSHDVIRFLEEFSDKHKPTMVLTHSVNDTHQDHRQVGWCSISAFRRNVPIMLAYESPSVTPMYRPAYFVDISGFTERKWRALKCHLHKGSKRLSYIAYESMINLASFRGSQANVGAAEAFEILRYVDRRVSHE